MRLYRLLLLFLLIQGLLPVTCLSGVQARRMIISE